MVEFTPLAEAIKSQAINVKGELSHISELKTGTGQYGEWQMKKITLKDSSGELEIAVWNKDIPKFTSGNYELINLQWKERSDKPGEWNASIAKNTVVIGLDGTTESPKAEPTPETPTEPTQTTMLTTNQKIVHDEIWAFAMSEATKVYPLGTASGDTDRTSRLILAQVFYKKNMDFYIHGGVK